MELMLSKPIFQRVQAMKWRKYKRKFGVTMLGVRTQNPILSIILVKTGRRIRKFYAFLRQLHIENKNYEIASQKCM